jgi:transposase
VIIAALNRARRRRVEDRTQQLRTIFAAPELRQPPALQAAYAAVVASEVAIITALNTQIDRLGAVVGEHFGRHRDAEIYLSQPGIGLILASRILGEFGDDPDRYADAKSRKNYAGTSPITKASGTKKVVLARYARNRRLGDALQQWVSAHCADHQEPRPTTTSSEIARSATRPPSDSSPTASSASSTAVSRPTPPTRGATRLHSIWTRIADFRYM